MTVFSSLQCLSTLKKPKSLPCHHTYCEQCLDTYHQTEQSKNQAFACPNCKKVFNNIKSIKELPVNFLIQSSLDLMKELWNELFEDDNKSDTPIYCIRCLKDKDEQTPAIKFCEDCKFPLCVLHDQLHQQGKKTKDHTLLSIDQVDKKQLLTDVSNRKPSCPKHKDEKLKYVCDCQELICPYCAIIDHKEHKQVEIEKAANGERDKLKQLVMETQKDAEQTAKSLSEFIDMMDRIEKKCNSECAKAEEAGQELKKQIDARVAKLVDELKGKKKIKLKNLELQKEHLNDMILRSKMDDIKLIEHAGNIKLLQMKKLMEVRHQELQKMMREPAQIEHRDTFEIQIDSNKCLLSIQKGGNVIVVSFDHCVVSGAHCMLFITTMLLQKH